jgi:hypothetical protein
MTDYELDDFDDDDPEPKKSQLIGKLTDEQMAFVNQQLIEHPVQKQSSKLAKQYRP